MARELKSVLGVADSELTEMFPSVLAVLDYRLSGLGEEPFVPNLPHLPTFTQPYRFQERGLAAFLPLCGGELLMKVHASYAMIVRDPAVLEESDLDTEWGEPLVEPKITFGERPEAPCIDTNKLFWEEQVPTFYF